MLVLLPQDIFVSRTSNKFEVKLYEIFRHFSKSTFTYQVLFPLASIIPVVIHILCSTENFTQIILSKNDVSNFPLFYRIQYNVYRSKSKFRI